MNSLQPIHFFHHRRFLLQKHILVQGIEEIHLVDNFLPVAKLLGEFVQKFKSLLVVACRQVISNCILEVPNICLHFGKLVLIFKSFRANAG